jgi:NADPH:quinone reductase-like Zn-dependent oxidoreductase
MLTVINSVRSRDVGQTSAMARQTVKQSNQCAILHAGVNPLDNKIRDGEFKLLLPHKMPLILGNDLAGVVVRVGARVRRFKAGDEVNRAGFSRDRFV